MALSASSPSGRRSEGGACPALAQRSVPSAITPMKTVTKLALGSRPPSSRSVWVRTSPGRSESQVRASTKKRTIALSAATSRPLPVTSPTSTASAPLGSVHTPKMSPPLTSWPAGS